MGRGFKREVLEECNLKVIDFREIVRKRFVYSRKGRQVVVIGHLMEVKEYGGRLRNREPEKHTRQEYMQIGRVKRLPYLSDLTVLYLNLLGYERGARLAQAK